MAECSCCQPPDYQSDFDVKHFGEYDDTNGRFGEVSIETCKKCGTKWLRYFVEYEAFSRSQRCYRGIMTEEISRKVTPQNAASIIEGLEWWISSGSFFDGKHNKGSGQLQLGIYGFEFGSDITK